ncbi:MAG: condensation domain-containing protein [Gordonia paraffinivorans]
MLLTTLANLRIPGGRMRRWAATAVGDGAPHPVGPSENERFHLEAVRAGASGWLAVTADIPTATVDPDRLVAAFLTVVDHHEVLRSHFVLDADGTPRRRLHERGAISMSPAGAVHTVDERAIRDELVQAVAGCTALTPASHVLAVIESAEVSTVVCAFDHCYVDAHSLAVIAEDLVAAYTGDPLPGAGSYLDHLADGGAAEPRDDDPGVLGWADFLAATDHTVPDYPLDLGVTPGEFAPSRILVTQVLPRSEADAHTESGTRRRVRTYPMLLTALAQATRDHGGPDRLPVVLPIHTRTDGDSSRSVGWCVANAPVVIDAGPTATDDPEQVLREATTAVADALPLAAVDLTTVYGRFGHLLRKPRHDVFMVSYLDYRRFTRLPSLHARHVSSDGRADDLQLWFWRDDDGISVRARFPDTAVAAPLITSVVDDLVTRARAAVPAGSDAAAAAV